MRIILIKEPRTAEMLGPSMESMSRRQTSMSVLLLPIFLKSTSDKLNTYQAYKGKKKMKFEQRIIFGPTKREAAPQECVGKHGKRSEARPTEKTI